jgi:iron complex outermembrane receptor protein
MPQNRILTGLKLDLPNFSIFKSNTFVLDYNYFFKQDFVSVFETKTAAYKLVNVAFNSKIGLSRNIEWSIGCKNLFNEMYIDHLSRLKNIGLESPGRNIFFKLTYRFTK